MNHIKCTRKRDRYPKKIENTTILQHPLSKSKGKGKREKENAKSANQIKSTQPKISIRIQP
jgi:hypothetical protein